MTPGSLDGGPCTVADVMITAPKTEPASASVSRVLRALDDQHVHMVLLVRAGKLLGTVVRGDLPATAQPTDTALTWSTVAGRTIAPDGPVELAHHRLTASDQRRLAVVSPDQRLLGLLCLKRNRSGFCSETDVRSRAHNPSTRPVRTPSPV